MEMTEVKTTGVTYSVNHYNHYMEHGDKNYFEEVIDAMILDGIAGMNESFRNIIQSLPRDKKRMTILSLLDKDLNLFKRIKALTDKDINKMEHIKDIILMLREYVKVGEVEKKKFGEVMTPLELVKEMLNTLPKEVWSNPYLKWLDPANGTGPYPSMVIYRLMEGLKEWEPDDEKRYKHIVENMIYVCELQPKNMFLYMCAIDPFDTYKLNIYTGSFLEEGFDKHMKEVWGVENFDIVMGNPPYNQNIDLKFLKKSHDISDIIIFIHPSVWIIDNKLKNKTFIETRRYIEDRLSNLTLLNANKSFQIGLFTPCVITTISKDRCENTNVFNKISGKKYITKNIEDIDLYDCDDDYLSIKYKIKKYCQLNGNLWLNCKRDYNGTHTFNDKEFEVGFSPIRGNVSQQDDSKMVMDDFYTFIQKKDECKHISSNFEGTKYKLKFGFDSLYEANNFLNYLKSNFTRFCVSIYKNSQTFHGGELEIVPYLDYSINYDDIKLMEIFNLSQSEMDFINKSVSKYYD